MRKRTIFLATLLACAVEAPATAQLATLVDDLNTSGSFEAASSSPNGFFDLGGKAVFFADVSPGRLGVWVTDGTAHGTEYLGPACSSADQCTQLRPVQVGGLVYWRERNLHRSDGTREGTLVLTHGSSEIAQPLLALASRVLFVTAVGNGVGQLWASDGTIEGTRLLATGVTSPGQSYLGAAVGGVALFTRRDDFGTRSLWRTDGTPEGTSEILPGQLQELDGVGALTANGRAFFLAHDSRGVPQLWASDGSSAGTLALTRFSGSSWTDGLSLTTSTAERLFFGVSTGSGPEMWVSDGTVAGTRKLAILGTPQEQGFFRVLPLGERLVLFGSAPSVESSVWVTSPLPNPPRRLAHFDYSAGEELAQVGDPVRIGSRVLFAVYHNFFQESRLWVTDGTPAGTHTLPLGFGDQIVGLVEVKNTAFVIAQDSEAGTELFRTDGTPQGTRRLTHFTERFAVSFSAGCYSPLGGDACNIGRFGTGFLLGATEVGYGNELWRLGQNEAATLLVADLARNAPSADPRDLGALGNGSLFTASDGTRTHLYRASGEVAVPLAEIGDNQNLPAAGVIYGESLAFFLARPEGQALGLFRSDGTTQGTIRLTPESGQAPALDPEPFLGTAGNTLYFTSDNGASVDLWRSDGTVQGTTRLFDIGSLARPLPGTGYGWNGELYFVGSEPEHGALNLWKTDGTPAGTLRLSDLSSLEAPFAGEPPRYTPAGGRLVLTFRGSSSFGFYLMATDGTSGGTEVLRDLFPQLLPNSELVSFQNRAFFLTWDDDFWTLWVSDGTDLGTLPLRRLGRAFFPGAAYNDLGIVGDRLYFVANGAGVGPQIWSTDGSAADFRQETTLPAGSPQELLGAGGRLFFTTEDGVFGRELWVLSQDEVGARLVHDLAPGPASSNPQELTMVGNRLYFSADDGVHGRELWSLDLTVNPTTCPPSDSGLCLQNNRFRVEIDWRDFQGNTGRGTPVPLTADTGYFWFFNPANVETIVKVLDGRPINEHFWTFYGALSNVEYTMTVTDAQSGLSQRYFNPSRQFASVGDTESFGPNGASLARFTAPNELLFQSHEPIIDSLFDIAKAGSCAPSSTRLCLNNGRFAVEATWKDFQNRTGVGMAQPLTGDTGYFWFFRDSNVEVVTKVLDGRPVNGKFWVFYGALSNVEYTLTVTDTETGAIKTYFNPSRRFGSVGDTGAF